MIKRPSGKTLIKGIRASFKEKSDREWRYHIEIEAGKRMKEVH
jgi:hypothetical protein